MDIDDRSWRFGRYKDDWTETSDEEKKVIEEWIKTHRPVFQVSTGLNHLENDLQYFESQATLVVGENPSPLYRHTISASLESFKDKISEWPTIFNYVVEERNALSVDTSTNIDFPYIVPMFDGYFLEFFSNQICRVSEYPQ